MLRSQCKWSSSALQQVAEAYAREAGLRQLERQIESVCRAVAVRIAKEECRSVSLTPKEVERMLGLAKCIRESRLRTEIPGEVTGLRLKIRAKSLAAVLRAGIKQVLIPKLNEKDLHKLPPEVLGKIKFVCASTVDEVLAAALVRKPAQRVVKVDQPSGSPKGHRVPC